MDRSRSRNRPNHVIQVSLQRANCDKQHGLNCLQVDWPSPTHFLFGQYEGSEHAWGGIMELDIVKFYYI